jgi:hypothetical protein
MLLEICGIDHHNLFVLAHSERLIPRLIDALASAAVGITTDLKVASADIVAPPYRQTERRGNVDERLVRRRLDYEIANIPYLRFGQPRGGESQRGGSCWCHQ